MPKKDINPQHAENTQNAERKRKTEVVRKKKRKVNPIKRTFVVIGTTLLSLVLLVIITGSIIAAALTVYIVQFSNEVDTIDLEFTDLELAYTTFIYAYDENESPVELTKISRAADRIRVDIDQIPQYVQDAFVYTEDERFYEHDGVDWKRTFQAFLNEILKMWSSRQGGSTITQQLVKNVTKDTEANWDRKMREIFRASQLEKFSPKQRILEEYLNFIGFGGPTAGVQAASLKYFGKNVWELSIAEGAILAAIPQNPEVVNPFNDREQCIERQREVVLPMMYKNAAISEKQYKEALAEELVFVDPNAKSEDEENSKNNGIQNWFTDMAIYDVIHDLMDLYGIEQSEASDMLYNGGYEVYTTVDLKMQDAVEAKFLDYKTFSDKVLTDPPEAAFICLDYQGNVKAVVGSNREKAGSNVLNRANMAQRSPGSCIKPITSYSYAIEKNLITWSSIFINKPVINDMIDEATGAKRTWPYNYNSRSYDYGGYFTFQALQRSLNTIPAQLVEMETPAAVFEFLQNRFQVTSLSVEDADLAPLSVGALTHGISLEELVAAYQPFGNAGKYFKPTTYTQVIDSNGKVILQHKYTPIQSISKESAYVMNKLMQTVIEGPNGTGKAARLANTPLIGKTGTSQDWHDLSFVGCTPDYVSGIWYGYDTPKQIPTGTFYSSAQVWKNVFGEIADAAPKKTFPDNSDVKELYYCTKTGLLASGTCPTGAVGYYKSDNIPQTCAGNHAAAAKKENTELE